MSSKPIKESKMTGILTNEDFNLENKLTAVTAEYNYKGNLDKCDKSRGICGWVINENHPNQPVELDIFIDKELITQTTANIFRSDLFNAGICNGLCAFYIAMPSKFCDEVQHTLEIKTSIDELTVTFITHHFVLPQISNQSRMAILVLGMHRSGTSAITRIINLLGADIAQDLMENNFANETGYWESIELAKIHDDILALLNSSWDDILPNNFYLKKANTNYYKMLLNDYLLKTFSQSSFFVIKDPRLCKLIPLWLEVLAQSNISVKIIIPFRNPLEVANSLQQRNGFSTEKSFLMWLRHSLEVEQHTRGLERCFINYAQLLTNSQHVIESMTKQCAIQWPNQIDLVLSEVNQFIDPSHYHQRVDNEQLMQASISTWISQAYTVLNKLAQYNNHQVSIERLDSITNALQQADKLYANIVADKTNDFEKLLTTYNALIETHQHNADIQQSINNEINAFCHRLAELNNSLR